MIQIFTTLFSIIVSVINLLVDSRPGYGARSEISMVGSPTHFCVWVAILQREMYLLNHVLPTTREQPFVDQNGFCHIRRERRTAGYISVRGGGAATGCLRSSQTCSEQPRYGTETSVPDLLLCSSRVDGARARG